MVIEIQWLGFSPDECYFSRSKCQLLHLKYQLIPFELQFCMDLVCIRIKYSYNLLVTVFYSSSENRGWSGDLMIMNVVDILCTIYHLTVFQVDLNFSQLNILNCLSLFVIFQVRSLSRFSRRFSPAMYQQISIDSNQIIDFQWIGLIT